MIDDQIIECGAQGCAFWGNQTAIDEHLLAMKLPPAPGQDDATTLHNHKAHGSPPKETGPLLSVVAAAVDRANKAMDEAGL